MFIIDAIKRWFSQHSYHSDLERYIISHNPKNQYDVERLTEEFDRRRFLQGDSKL